MEWKLFLSTFGLIFLAELGDKTQLAAFAATAGSKSPVSVFLGASAALVMSTLIAVALGSVLQKVVPVSWLKLGAGILFIIMGAAFVVNVALTRPAKPVAARAAADGILAKIVLRMAVDFEESTSDNYDALAAATKDERLKSLLDHLFIQEKEHLEKVKGMVERHGESSWMAGSLKPVERLAVADAPVSAEGASVAVRARDHELATARFYEELARVVPVKNVREVLTALAAEETGHARHLDAYLAGAEGARPA